jgi:hypothetical protein
MDSSEDLFAPHTDPLSFAGIEPADMSFDPSDVSNGLEDQSSSFSLSEAEPLNPAVSLDQNLFS